MTGNINCNFRRAAPSSPPMNVVVVSKTSQTLTLSWLPPPSDKRNGRIHSYTITITEIETEKISNISTNTTVVTLSSLHPYYQYAARVKAKTVAFGPYSASITVQLDEDGTYDIMCAMCNFRVLLDE